MPDYILAPPPVAAVPVQGSDALFPVRRIFCVGRNYAEHAIEMGSDPTREPPFYFAKPADALVINGADMPYPSMTKDLHHEMELVVAIGAGLVVVALTAGIFVFLFAFQEYLTAAILTDTASKTVPVFITTQLGQTLPMLQQAGAAAMLLTLPVIGIAFIAQKYLVAGLASGAVKG